MRSGTSERDSSRMPEVLSKVSVRGRKLWQLPIARTIPDLPSSVKANSTGTGSVKVSREQVEDLPRFGSDRSD